MLPSGELSQRSFPTLVALPESHSPLLVLCVPCRLTGSNVHITCMIPAASYRTVCIAPQPFCSSGGAGTVPVGGIPKLRTRFLSCRAAEFATRKGFFAMRRVGLWDEEKIASRIRRQRRHYRVWTSHHLPELKAT